MTVLFTDLVGSTELAEALDPEVLRPALGDYFEACRTAIERHGGTVEKYIGDAVMALFGFPVAHEDDALRAVRAAQELSDRVATVADRWEPILGSRLRIRSGVQTGPVLAGGGAAGEPMATGDAVNTAARLQACGAPGEVILGDGTEHLVRAWVATEPLEPVELKGKSRPVEAFRLVGVQARAARALDGAGLHGREAELARLDAHRRSTVASGCAEGIRIVGEAGIGKSHLVRRFLADLPDGTTAAHATVAPYGEETLAPIAALLRAVLDPGGRSGAEELRETIAARLAGVEHADEIRDHLEVHLGLVPGTVRVEELGWALRTLLSACASERPLVLAVEDLHWAEPTLIRLLAELPLTVLGPLLLVTTTRPEPVGPDEASASDAPSPAWSRMDLGTLDAVASTGIIERVLGGRTDTSLAAPLLALAGGNPLFLEQTVASLVEEGRLAIVDDRWIALDRLTAVTLPATIDALVAARLDRLQADERTLLELIAVAGLRLDASLAIGEDGLPPRAGLLGRLAHLALIDPWVEGRPIAYRHALVRDAVHASIAKRRRAIMHATLAARFADADGVLAEGSDRDLLIGHHLEAAVRYRRELRLVGDETDGLALDAGAHLLRAGRRAYANGDMAAAADRLGRVADLLPADAPERVAVLPDLAKARLEAGDDRARATIEEAVARSAAAGMVRENAHARIQQYIHAIWFERSVTGQAEQADLEAIGDELEAAGDPKGAALAWGAVAEIGWFTGDPRAAARASVRAAALARSAGDLWAWREYLALSAGDAFGDVSVDDLPHLEAMLMEAGDHPVLAARVLPVMGAILAARGAPDDGRAMVRRGLEHARELGLRVWESELATAAAWFELTYGDPAEALILGRSAHDIAAALGDRPHLSAAAAMLARVHAFRREDAEAIAAASLAHETRPGDTSLTEAWWMVALVDVAIRAGDVDRAEQLARAALAIATDIGEVQRAMAELALADVLEARGDLGGADDLRRAARDRYLGLGQTVLAERAQALIRSTPGRAPRSPAGGAPEVSTPRSPQG